MPKEFSKEARSALLAATGRTGAKVHADSETLAELEQAGCVTVSANLTLTGAVERSRVFEAALDEAFS